MTDEELATAILEDLRSNRTSGAGGKPLAISDANLATRLRVDLDQLNRVLQSLIDGGLVHGHPASKIVTSDVRPEWDLLRLAEDPLPPE